MTRLEAYQPYTPTPEDDREACDAMTYRDFTMLLDRIDDENRPLTRDEQVEFALIRKRLENMEISH